MKVNEVVKELRTLSNEELVVLDHYLKLKDMNL